MVKVNCRGLYMMFFTSFRIVSLTAESVRSASERTFILIIIFFTLRPAASQQSRSVNDPPLFFHARVSFLPRYSKFFQLLFNLQLFKLFKSFSLIN